MTSMEHDSQTKDVTAIFDNYRMAARSLWNTGFWPDTELRNWDSVERFHAIARLLFDALVLAKLDKDFPLEIIFKEPIAFFRVVASASSVPIIIARAAPQNNIWDDPVDRISEE